MMFFVSKINSYSCVNNKGREVQKWLESFAHHLIPNELSKDAWIEGLRLKLQDFDEQFPRSTPLFLVKPVLMLKHRTISLYILKTIRKSMWLLSTFTRWLVNIVLMKLSIRHWRKEVSDE